MTTTVRTSVHILGDDISIAAREGITYPSFTIDTSSGDAHLTISLTDISEESRTALANDLRAVAQAIEDWSERHRDDGLCHESCWQRALAEMEAAR